MKTMNWKRITLFAFGTLLISYATPHIVGVPRAFNWRMGANRKSWFGRCLLLLSAALMVPGPSIAQKVSQEEIDRYAEIKKAAKEEKIDAAVQEDQTGTDPRSFSNKWMPYYRYTELENGLTQQDLTAFGTIGFSPRVGMFYELPLAQYRDFSNVPGLPPGAASDAIGLGDMNLKFLVRPKAMDFTYGKEGKLYLFVGKPFGR